MVLLLLILLGTAHAQDAPLGEVPLVEVPSGDRLDPALLESDPAAAAEGKRVDVEGVPIVAGQAGRQENRSDRKGGRAGRLAGLLADWWELILMAVLLVFGGVGISAGSAMYAYRNGGRIVRMRWAAGQLTDADGAPLPTPQEMLARLERAEQLAQSANQAAQAARRGLAEEASQQRRAVSQEIRELADKAMVQVDHTGNVQRAKLQSALKPLVEHADRLEGLLLTATRIDP